MFLQANGENGYLWSEQKKINFFSLIFLCSTLSARGCGGPFLNIQVLTIDLLKTILFYKKASLTPFLSILLPDTLIFSRKLALSMFVPCLSLWKTIIINCIFYLGIETQELQSESFTTLVSKRQFISRR